MGSGKEQEQRTSPQPAPATGSAHIQHPPTDMPGYWYSDVAKTLLGTFVGAGLAFASNWWFQRRARIRDELASGRRDLFTIRAQLDEFVNCRYAIRQEMSRMHVEIGDAPDWVYAKPLSFSFSSSNLFDFKSLAFLLSTATGRAAFERLQFTERTYLDITARLSDFHSSEIGRAHV